MTFLVSFIASIKNEELYVKDAIESIVNQELNNKFEIEIIVANDNSNDNTLKILMDLKSQYNNIKVLDSKKEGKNSAYNLCYKYSNGDYIFIFAGDDLIPSDSTKNRLDSILKFCSDNKLSPLSIPLAQFSKMKSFSDNQKFDQRIFPPKHIKKGTRSGGAIFMNRKAADKVFKIPTKLAAEDTWISLCIENFCTYYDYPYVTYLYRIHKGNSVPRDLDFDSYRHYRLERLKAYSFFFHQFSNILEHEKLNKIANLNLFYIKTCIGDWLGLIFAKVPFNMKLKSLAICNRLFFSIFIIAQKTRLITM